MCLDSALDLWPPGHFELGFFASRIRRSEMECSALGFSYERWKPRNGQLAKMRSFHQSKRSDNKQYTVEVRWHIFFLRIWRIFLFLRTVVDIPIQILIIPPWQLLRKMIISRLELGRLCMSRIARKRKSTDLYVRQIPGSEVQFLYCLPLPDLFGSTWNIFICATDQAWGQNAWLLAESFIYLFAKCKKKKKKKKNEA